MPTVKVSIDTSFSPPKLLIDPLELPIPKKTKATIRWKRQSTDFELAGLVFSKPNPISSVAVSAATITAVDDNQKKQAHPYLLFFKYRETFYLGGANMMGGGPTIRNN
jgi:hypothetical protein